MFVIIIDNGGKQRIEVWAFHLVLTNSDPRKLFILLKAQFCFFFFSFQQYLLNAFLGPDTVLMIKKPLTKMGGLPVLIRHTDQEGNIRLCKCSKVW